MDIQSIRAEFESFYSCICNLLSTSQWLILKQKLICLNSLYATSFHNSTKPIIIIVGLANPHQQKDQLDSQKLHS